MINPNTLLWVENYKPHSLEECILPDRIKQQLRQMIKDGNIQSYLASGKAGSGKTSSALAMCEELGIEPLIINASSEGNIDTIRTKVVNFASRKSIDSDVDYKVIILDEGDGLTALAQQALRGVIEEFQVNCRFIITANFSNKIIDALKSRCTPIEFNFTNDEKKQMSVQFTKRVCSVLKELNIVHEPKDLLHYVIAKFPDFRSVWNELQKNVHDGVLNIGTANTMSVDSIDRLITIFKQPSPSFKEMKAWVADNLTSDCSLIRRALFDNMNSFIFASSQLEMILFLNEYDYKEFNVLVKEINLIAMLTNIMLSPDIKFL